MAVYFVSSEKKKFHHFCPTYETSWFHLENSSIQPLGKIFRRPCTQRLINHGQLVHPSAFIRFNEIMQ